MAFVDFKHYYMCPDQIGWFEDFCSVESNLAFLQAPFSTRWVVSVTTGYARQLDLKFYYDQVRSFVALEVSNPEGSRITWANSEHM